jgi:hypothetical protein
MDGAVQDFVIDIRDIAAQDDGIPLIVQPTCEDIKNET